MAEERLRRVILTKDVYTRLIGYNTNIGLREDGGILDEVRVELAGNWFMSTGYVKRFPREEAKTPSDSFIQYVEALHSAMQHKGLNGHYD